MMDRGEAGFWQAFGKQKLVAEWVLRTPSVLEAFFLKISGNGLVPDFEPDEESERPFGQLTSGKHVPAS